MDSVSEPTRIRTGDALALVLEDLAGVAATAMWNAAAFGRWFAASVDLLACVPHPEQRVSWAYHLVRPLTGGEEWALVVLRQLLEYAEAERSRTED